VDGLQLGALEAEKKSAQFISAAVPRISGNIDQPVAAVRHRMPGSGLDLFSSAGSHG
jgi:hypothetical protein